MEYWVTNQFGHVTIEEIPIETICPYTSERNVTLLAQLLAQLSTHSFGMHRINLSTDPCITWH